MHPPRVKIEVIKGNGVGPHGNGPIARYPIGRGQTDTYYNTKPIGTGTMSLPAHGDKNNALDTSFSCRFNHYHVEFQKYFLVKNLKVRWLSLSLSLSLSLFLTLSLSVSLYVPLSLFLPLSLPPPPFSQGAPREAGA